MIVDCGDCVMRNKACGDCVVSVLLGVPDPSVGVAEAAGMGGARSTSVMPLQQDERDAMAALAEGGLVPHLRLIHRAEPEGTPECVVPPTEDRKRRIG